MCVCARGLVIPCGAKHVHKLVTSRDQAHAPVRSHDATMNLSRACFARGRWLDRRFDDHRLG